MTDYTIDSELDEPAVAGVSWAAVAAGAVTSLALTLALIALGVGLGLSVVSPWAGSGVSAGPFKIGTGLYLIVIAMIASSVGGYLAGRLRNRFVGVHTDEVYFRDTAHGFVAWAFATVLGAVLLTGPASVMIGGTAAGLTSGATTGASMGAAQNSGPMDVYVDRLLRADPAASSTSPGSSTATPSPTPGGPANTNASDPRPEMLRLFTRSFTGGNTDFAAGDRDYVVKVVAARTGLSQADAEKRVNDTVTQMKANLDEARKGAAKLSFWLLASLLLGAFSASLAATEGGSWRDGKFYARRESTLSPRALR